MFHIFTEPIKGYEQLWILGDAFTASSFEQYYKLKAMKDFAAGHMIESYDVMARSGNKYTSNDPNILSRLRNMLIGLIHQEVKLPKMIIIVLDDDLVKYYGPDEDDECLEKAFKRLLNELMTEFRKIISTQKERLPKKAQRPFYPQMVWIEAPLNKCFGNNRERKIFNKSLNSSAKFQENVSVLALKKIWDYDNTRLFVNEALRYTSEGLSMYWAAVDCTVRFMDTILFHKIEMRASKKARNDSKADNSENAKKKYKWESESFKRKSSDQSSYREGRPKDRRYDDNYYPSFDGRRRLPEPRPQNYY